MDTANMLPGDKNLSRFYGSNGKYVCATVSYINFSNGEEWEAVNLDTWATETKKNFAVTHYDKLLEELTPNAILAETNEYVSIVRTHKKNQNQFSNNDDIIFTLENIGQKDIISVTMLVLKYDKNGYPVTVSPYDAYEKKCKTAWWNH